MRKALFSFLMLAAVAVACTKEQPKDDEKNPGKDTTEAKIELTSNASVSVPVEGDAVTINFKATADWTAASDAEWLTLTTKSGKAGDACSVKGSVVKNETNDIRTAKVTITAGKATAEVTVTQDQTNALNIKVLDYDVPVEGGTVEVEVEANVEYEVTIPEAVDWVHNGASKGMTTSKVTLTVDQSYDVEVREANIKISAGDLSSSIKISQAAFEPYYDMELPEGVGMFSGYGDGNPLVLPADATEFTIPVSTNMEHHCYFAPWDATVGAAVETNDVGWIKFEYDNEKIVFTLEPNNTFLAREEYFYSGCHIGDIDFGAYGCCILIRQEGQVPEAGASVLWTKTLAEISDQIKPAYNRLAYKTSGGDALLLSDGEKVHVMSPADGSYWKAITWTGVKPTSIASDDAGNVIVGEDIPFTSGTTYSVYYTTNVNEEPVKLFDHTADFDGTIGSWRVRGDLSNRAVVTGFVTGNRYWAGWEIDNFAVSLDNGYNVNGQARGPIAVDADAWNPESGAVMSVGPRLNEGVVYRAYDTSWKLYYLADAYTPNWITPYNWVAISDAGAGAGNENQCNMDIIDYQGRRIIAYTQGVWFNWGGNRDVYFLDITNPEQCEVLAVLTGDQMAAAETIDASVPYADVKLHVEEGLGLVCYVVNSAYGSLSKVLLTLE
ncbi:MAG: BACON domain-containing protein [Bacteroidales bacterium]|nr:BACON domain-containing protein [Bacteroidales bacterium]